MLSLPLFFGFLIDCVLGDPYSLPHPIRLIGSLIAGLEKLLRPRIKNERTAGTVLVIIVLILSAGVPLALLMICYKINLILGIAAESIMCYYLVAARCLRNESMKVHDAFAENDTEKARQAVSMIVGRDTKCLDRDGIIRAAVETVAENTSDGVTAPMFYMALGGAVGGFLYKAANTMDSMLGYTNDKYINFGRTAAKLDDVLNYIPSRLTALLMILSAYILRFDGKNAFRIWKRDRRKHASPNSAQTESVCAGALGIQLAGDASYFGKVVKKPYIGDPKRQVEYEDIRRANRLMNLTAWICEILCLGILMIVAV